MVDNNRTPARAWRMYLGLTQVAMADRLGIARPTYALQEANRKLHETGREKIAAALGIDVSLLDL